MLPLRIKNGQQRPLAFSTVLNRQDKLHLHSKQQQHSNNLPNIPASAAALAPPTPQQPSSKQTDHPLLPLLPLWLSWLFAQGDLSSDKPVRILGERTDPSRVLLEMTGSLRWTARRGLIVGVSMRRPRPCPEKGALVTVAAGGNLQVCCTAQGLLCLCVVLYFSKVSPSVGAVLPE